MNSFYQLIDLTSGHVIDDFDTEYEALDLLNEIENEHGEHELQGLCLFYITEGKQTLIAMEQELVALTAKHAYSVSTESTTTTVTRIR